MAEKQNPSRPWLEIAKEVCKEQNPYRFLKLAVELDKALQAEENKEKKRKSPSGSIPQRGSQS